MSQAPSSDSADWYCHKHGGLYGPWSLAGLREELRTGRLNLDSAISEGRDGAPRRLDDILARIDGSYTLPQRPPQRDQAPTRGGGGVSRNVVSAVIVGGLVLWVLYAFGWFAERGFSEADLAAMKRSIRAEYEKEKGVRVLDVVMFKENSTRAVGMVKLSMPVLGELTKSCSATREEGGRQYLWRCR